MLIGNASGSLCLIFLRTLAIERLMNRNGFSREECEKRISSQLPSEERVKYATRVIHNSGTREELESIIRSCWNEAIIENNNI